MHILVLPQQLFPDGWKCTPNVSISIALHLKTHSIPESKFRKILVKNTTIIANEINKLRLQILEAIDIKTPR